MKLGTNDIGSVYLGTNAVNAVYLGTNLVWQNAPVATAATGIGQTSFTANWNAYTGATYYLLDVSASPTFDTFIYENEQVNAPTTSYVVIGLNPNTTYYYRVRASTEALTDPDYQAVLDYATTQGYTLPSSSQQVLQNQLVVDLKAAGIWSKLDTFAVFATDGSSDFALIDWKRLTDYTAVNSPTFTANEGFEGNGTSAYINTNYTFNTDFINPSQNDQSIFAYHFKDNAPLNNLSLTLNVNGGQIQINPRNTANSYAMRLSSGSNYLDTYIQVIGLHSLSRNNSSNYNYYIDGTNQVNITSTSVSYTTADMVLLGIPSIPFFTNPAISMVGYGASLDATENLDLYNAWNNYYASL